MAKKPTKVAKLKAVKKEEAPVVEAAPVKKVEPKESVEIKKIEVELYVIDGVALNREMDDKFRKKIRLAQEFGNSLEASLESAANNWRRECRVVNGEWIYSPLA